MQQLGLDFADVAGAVHSQFAARVAEASAGDIATFLGASVGVSFPEGVQQQRLKLIAQLGATVSELSAEESLAALEVLGQLRLREQKLL